MIFAQAASLVAVDVEAEHIAIAVLASSVNGSCESLPIFIGAWRPMRARFMRGALSQPMAGKN